VKDGFAEIDKVFLSRLSLLEEKGEERDPLEE
jgi:hypothetical protein